MVAGRGADRVAAGSGCEPGLDVAATPDSSPDVDGRARAPGVDTSAELARSTGTDRLPPAAYAASLASLPRTGPARLTAIVGAEPLAAAWARVRAGRGWTEPSVLAALGPRAQELVEGWRAAAAGTDPREVWRRVVDEGVGVAVVGSDSYPPALAGDLEPPAVLFHRGSLDVITGPRVAIVGTRRCTATGAAVALDLGHDLARAGVTVVSGLATGIDTAAHRGALAADGAPPIGVVASGLDVVYPRGQSKLWRTVAEAGLLLSEAPLGCPPERWRFPARNRIMAALAHLVVVVESHARGGAFHTVDAADQRGVDVMAVPGSVRNPAAGGVNALLAEGRAPVTCVDDILVALELQAATGRERSDRRRPTGDDDRAVLDALGWHAATLDQLVLRTGERLGALVLALDRLQDGGWVVQRGGWYERVPGGPASGAGRGSAHSPAQRPAM